MATTSGSVSKGCFAFKGKKKNARVGDYLPSVKKHNMRRCHERYKQMWDAIDTQIQILQSDFNCNIFEDLLVFTQSSCSGFTLEPECTSHKLQSEIPAAALVTGVNMPDHSTMFVNLVCMLRDRVSSLVAILKSKDCHNVKSILAKTLSQLMENQGNADDDLQLGNMPLTLSSLAKWYSNKYKHQPSSPKKSKSGNGKGVSKGAYPPIIIVMEDFENFTPKVIQDFITISSNYIEQLPLVFIFGIATSVSAIHRLLPNDVSCLLCMEKFQAPASTEYLTLVINQILMTSRYPFKLGRGVFQLLLDIFLYYDFSVINFTQALRYAMLEHYTSQPLSFLCCNIEEIECAVMEEMEHKDVEQLRQLSSFRRYVEGCSKKEQPDLLLNEAFTKERILELMRQMDTYHSNLFPILRCLHTLVSKLPGCPLGKQLREVYCQSLEGNIYESEHYKQAMDLLKMMAKDELRNLLEMCTAHVTGDAELKHIHTEIQSYLYKIDHIDELYVEEEPVAKSEEPSQALPSRTSLHQLRQKLQDMSKHQKKLSPYEKLREEIIQYFDSIFRKYAMCPTSLPLHEIFYYNGTRNVKQRLNASPRSALQMALSNPNYYLQCKCCPGENPQVCSSMPDTCVVYKLHVECGQLINLYDWMQAFMTVVEAEDADIDQSSSNHKLQARFIQAVSHLQFLGFVKPTKRKTDHVARLTWGGC